jgi:predicted RND superfamily exporter protein
MTATAIMGGLLPIMWGTGSGADMMKRIAAPMVGGMVTATVLTLLVIPALYVMWRGTQHRKEFRAFREAEEAERQAAAKQQAAAAAQPEEEN